MYHVARAMQAALESAGTRRRAMGWRINSGMLATFGKVLLLIPGLFLLALLMRLVFPW